MNNETFTRLEVEAALCAWEAMQVTIDALEQRSSATEAWGGTPGMRHGSITIGQTALKIWDQLDEHEREKLIPYDWNFMAQVVKHSGFTDGPEALKTPEQIMGKIKQST